MVFVCHVRMSSAGVRAPVSTANGIGYWKGVIKITCDTDCYYCIIIFYCSPLAWYYFCATVIKFPYFLVYWLYLHDWAHVTMIMYTCACLRTTLDLILRARWVVFLTTPDLHVQIPELGLKWTRPWKIRLSLRSKRISRSSFPSCSFLTGSCDPLFS